MNKIITNEYGNIEIAKDTIATIASTLATDCYGLAGMASQNLKDGISGLLGREASRKGVEVSIKDGSITIEVYIIVMYGVRIFEVAGNVREKIKHGVESMLGIKVDKVNVTVHGVKVIN